MLQREPEVNGGPVCSAMLVWACRVVELLGLLDSELVYDLYAVDSDGTDRYLKAAKARPQRRAPMPELSG